MLKVSRCLAQQSTEMPRCWRVVIENLVVAGHSWQRSGPRELPRSAQQTAAAETESMTVQGVCRQLGIQDHSD